MLLSHKERGHLLGGPFYSQNNRQVLLNGLFVALTQSQRLLRVYVKSLTCIKTKIKKRSLTYRSLILAQKHVPLQVDGLSLLAASISHWLRKPAVDVPHVLLATNFHSLLQLGLLPSSGLLSLLVVRDTR